MLKPYPGSRLNQPVIRSNIGGHIIVYPPSLLDLAGVIISAGSRSRSSCVAHEQDTLALPKRLQAPLPGLYCLGFGRISS